MCKAYIDCIPSVQDGTKIVPIKHNNNVTLELYHQQSTMESCVSEKDLPQVDEDMIFKIYSLRSTENSLKSTSMNIDVNIRVGAFKMFSQSLTAHSTVLSYLWNYGYLKNVVQSKTKIIGIKEDDTVSPCDIIDSIKNFQMYSNLEVTGRIDTETIKTMQMPRCGLGEYNECHGDYCEDVKVYKRNSKTLKYRLRKIYWNTTDIHYFIYNCSNKMEKDDCIKQLDYGFKNWARYAPIKFMEVGNAGQANITVMFTSETFNGSRGILGYAEYPPEGIIYLDGNENFTQNSNTGSNLEYVFTHQLGHALGILHSSETNSIMSPIYNGSRDYKDGLTFNKDDIAAIQALYGAGAGSLFKIT